MSCCLTGDCGRRGASGPYSARRLRSWPPQLPLEEKILDLGVPGDRVHVWERGIDSDIFKPGSRVASRRRLGIPVDGRALVW